MFFMEFSINIGSMLALVMLVGLTVNNAILIIDYAMQRVREGKNTVEALWSGIEAKFKPVIMTSIAIIAGTFPQILDANLAKASMGAVIIGGMLGSIFFTYALVPPTFLIIRKLNALIDKKS
jgi:HAE1 family hydrophobic/amphiphilic exporter-1